MTILAEMGNRVLYVEPNHPMFARRGQSGSLTEAFTEARKNLFVLRPRGILPLARFEAIRKANLGHYIKGVNKTLRRLGFEKPILFTYLPTIHVHSPFVDILDHLDNSLLVYDCVDEHSENIGYSPEVAAAVRKCDLDLTTRADLVFVTARGLYDDRKHLNKHLYLSPNGVDVEHFSKALLDGTEIPSDLAVIPEPRVGFVGALSGWIDFRLIAQVARCYPDYQVVLIGPLERGLKPAELADLDNVHFLGKKKLKDLPGYMKGFDCGINPFRRVGIAERVNPLKVYEYLAAGLPVISTDMPEVMPLAGIISIGRDDDEFVQNVGKVVRGEIPRDEAKLQEKLKQHDWDLIFSEVIDRVAAKVQQ